MGEKKTIASMLRLHFDRNSIFNGDSKLWEVKESPLGGRGLFATRDVAVGELIYVDAPLVFGPRARDKHLPLCAVCYKTKCPLFSCDGGCALPVCSTDCEISSEHERECALLRSWKPRCGSSWSLDILRALVPVRALFLDIEERQLLYAFQWHRSPRHSLEIDILKSHTETEIERADLQFMQRVCAVLDTNSFETAALVSGSMSSLRGLYPMGALQNHSCVPNTRHYYDSAKKLHVVASKAISKGLEITMTYTDLFWDTTLRRRHLAGTKNFLCRCDRCADRSEYGAFLGALRCADENCPGVLLPIEPLDSLTIWRCDKCGVRVKNRQVVAIRSALGSIASEMTYKNPRQLLRFFKRELPTLVPMKNYVSVDMKLRIISSFGNIDDFFYKDLNDDEIRCKEVYCRELLSLIETLKCGECKMKGLISYELYNALTELEMRRMKGVRNCGEDSAKLQKKEIKIREEQLDLLKNASTILENDITAPRDFLISDVERNLKKLEELTKLSNR